MPRNRQAGSDPEQAIAIRTLGLQLASGQRIDPHAHAWPQLIYATHGVMTIGTETGTWVIPSHRAAWVPSGETAARTSFMSPL